MSGEDSEVKWGSNNPTSPRGTLQIGHGAEREIILLDSAANSTSNSPRKSHRAGFLAKTSRRMSLKNLRRSLGTSKKDVKSAASKEKDKSSSKMPPADAKAKELAKEICEKLLAGTVEAQEIGNFTDAVRKVTNGAVVGTLLWCSEHGQMEQVAFHIRRFWEKHETQRDENMANAILKCLRTLILRAPAPPQECIMGVVRPLVVHILCSSPIDPLKLDIMLELAKSCPEAVLVALQVEESRTFPEVIGFLTNDFDKVEEMRTKLNTLKLVHLVVGGEKDIEKRFQVRNAFLAHGLDAALEKLRGVDTQRFDNLLLILNEFEEGIVNDHRVMMTRRLSRVDERSRMQLQDPGLSAKVQNIRKHTGPVPRKTTGAGVAGTADTGSGAGGSDSGGGAVVFRFLRVAFFSPTGGTSTTILPFEDNTTVASLLEMMSGRLRQSLQGKESAYDSSDYGIYIAAMSDRGKAGRQSWSPSVFLRKRGNTSSVDVGGGGSGGSGTTGPTTDAHDDEGVDGEGGGGTWICGGSGDPEKMGDYKLVGDEILAEYKLKPWNVSVLLDAALRVNVTFSPELLVATAASIAIEVSPAPLEQREYGLFLQRNAETGDGQWLEDTHMLLSYPEIVHESNCKLLLREKPREVTVHFADGTSVSLAVDLESTVSRFIVKILRARSQQNGANRGRSNMSQMVVDYGLTYNSDISPESPELEWLEEDKKLSFYNVFEGVALRLLPRPRPLQVVCPGGELVTVLAFYNRTTNDAIAQALQAVRDQKSEKKKVSDDGGSGDDDENEEIHPEKFIMRGRKGTLSADDNMLLPWASLRSEGVGEQMNRSDRVPKVFLEPRYKDGEDPSDAKAAAAKAAGVAGIGMYEDEEQDKDSDYMTLNQIVRSITGDGDMDINLVKMVLWTYRSFTDPETFLSKLVERFKVPEDMDLAKKKLIQMRVCTALKHWIELMIDDLAPIMTRIADFIEKDLAAEDQLQDISGRLKKSIAKKRERDLRRYKFLEAPPDPRLPKVVLSFAELNQAGIAMQQGGLHFLDMDELEMARQLTIPSFFEFAKIKPTELFNSAWTKSNSNIISPHVMNMINTFNYVANWVSSSIVLADKLSLRTKVFLRHIMVAHHLSKLNNFHLLMAYVSGLNNSAILRLKHTKAKLPKRALQIMNNLEALTNMEGSYKTYREALLNATPPCVPYIGVCLMDLTFIEDGNPDMKAHFINFKKRKLVYEIICTIQKFQTVAYNLQPVSIMELFFVNLPQLEDKEMYAKSLEIEPRNATRGDIK